MPKTRRGLRSSRRVESLQDADIDHEITIIDHDSSATELPSRPSAGSTVSGTHDMSLSNQPLVHSDSTVPLTASTTGDVETTRPDPSTKPKQRQAGVDDEQPDNGSESNDAGPSIIINQPTPNERGPPITEVSNEARPTSANAPETAIDILYENERGGFLCGTPLFSGAALGNLDPTPWTNFAHKPSPTDIHTAQVPDPSWQWAWPEWRINRDDKIETDNDGWEYSFMFSKKFSWHGPRWYNSFVRRRAWIRRRVKKGLGYQANDPHLMNEDYFQVAPRQKPNIIARSQSISRTSSVGDRLSLATLPNASKERSRSPPSTRGSRHSAFLGDGEETDDKPDILRVEDLMLMLRISRIDREKLEAVDNYIANSQDDLQLEQHMHEIMSVFVFQASRKLLLTRLMQVYDDLTSFKGKHKDDGSATASGGDEDAMERKKANLAAAIKHADEEVRKLEYWSDIKSMAENGQSGGAVESDKGWDDGWDGLDNSGAKGARNEELPTTSPNGVEKKVE